MLTNLDFPRVSRQQFGIEAVEYVNQFFMDKAEDRAIWPTGAIALGEGVENLLIMCDNEGRLGDPLEAERRAAAARHYKWADAAKALGCHSIRVNLETGDVGSRQEQQQRAADGLPIIAAHCADLELYVLVENHGGLSSDADWLSGVVRMVSLPYVGTLPDFGNFVVDRETNEVYDRYRGILELMPFARGISAKSREFDAEGAETTTDLRRMLQIVKDANYRGHIGIEYVGDFSPAKRTAS